MRREVKTTAFGRYTRFVRKDLWELRSHELPWHQRSGVHALRLASLVVTGFRRNQCALHAASLTFFSLMALIPVLALTLAMARTFGGAELARTQINKHLNDMMAQMEQAVEVQTVAEDATEKKAKAEVTKVFSTQVREIADKLFAQINQLGFGTLGGIGAVMLIWTVIGVLGKVESSFNQVWGVEKPRPLARKFADYLSVILILPFLITAVSTVPVVKMITQAMDQTVGGPAAEFFQTILKAEFLKTGITLTIGTLTFAFLLGFMPNVRVKVVPALVGGFVTTVLFGGWLKLCAMLQVGIAGYSALYGGFAVLPILLMWVYTSWQIVLLGSELSFAVQNRDTYVLEQNAAGASMRARLLLALTLCAETARQAREPDDGGPFAAEAFAKQRGIPSRFVKDILDDLVRNQMLAEVANRPGEYLLYRCGNSITIADITKVLLDDGAPIEALGLNNLSASILAFSKKLDETIDAALSIPVAQV
ncbi:MAG: YhjD/YihY/BrkB family envelope integrity protein [bacterium]